MDIPNTRKVEVQTFKVILDCTASSRLAWAIKDPVFKKKNLKNSQIAITSPLFGEVLPLKLLLEQHEKF